VDKIIDTTAAGDSFNSAYLAARLLGFDPFKACLYGHKLAAKVITQVGANYPQNENAEFILRRYVGNLFVSQKFLESYLMSNL